MKETWTVPLKVLIAHSLVQRGTKKTGGGSHVAILKTTTTKNLKMGLPVCVCVCLCVCVDQAVPAEKLTNCRSWRKKVKKAREGWRDGWSKGVVVVERGGGGRKVLLLLLEKSSGGFVLYLVPCGGFLGCRVALAAVFSRCWCPVFGLGLVALSPHTLLALHIRCVAGRTVL